MLNKRFFWGLSAFFTLGISITLGFMLLKKDGFVSVVQNQKFEQHILEEKLQIEQNIIQMMGDLSQLNIPTRIGSIFKERSLRLDVLKDLFQGKLEKVLFANFDGQVLLSDKKEEIGRTLSRDIRSWIDNQDKDSSIFLSDRNKATLLTWYDDPHSLKKRGYLLIEIPANLLFEGSQIVEYYVRFMKPQKPLLIVSNEKKILNSQKASNIAIHMLREKREQFFSKHRYKILDILYLGELVYFGKKNHIPLLIILLFLCSLSLSVFSLLRSIKSFTVKKNFEEKDEGVWDNINQLIEDISNDTVYEYKKAKDMINKAMEFGHIPMEETENTENILITPHENEENSQEPIFDTIKKSGSEIHQSVMEKMKESTSLKERILERFAQIFMHYDVTKYAIGIQDGEAFVFDSSSSNLDIEFLIEKTDPLYIEVLSKHQVLSLSGNLEYSDYLKQILPEPLLEDSGELFIIPILEGFNIQAILLLLRNGDLPLLSNNDKEKIFTQGAKI